jgi:predicted  nucleic acid-binding Zn-ribbon protein
MQQTPAVVSLRYNYQRLNIRISINIMATVKKFKVSKQKFKTEYEQLEDYFEQLRSDYWSVRTSLDEANKKIVLLQSLCRIHGISIPEEMPF